MGVNFDIINGCFELIGGFIYILNIKAIIKDKRVEGVSLLPAFFFSSWGIWNLLYYPSLEQWFSFIGAIGLVIANTTWLILALYYNKGKM